MISKKLREIDFEPKVLMSQISQILTDAILEGLLKGGDQLVESELQKGFGISRSPLREAFRDLEKKGLVEIVPRKGTFVKRIVRKDIEEHFPVRAALEGLAAREGYKKMTNEDLDEMCQAFEKMKTAVRVNDSKAYWEHHRFFHEVFINASGNATLIRTLQPLRMHVMYYRFTLQYCEEDLESSLKAHRRILNLFKRKTSTEEQIESTVRKHIEIAVDRFLDYLNEGNGTLLKIEG